MHNTNFTRMITFFLCLFSLSVSYAAEVNEKIVAGDVIILLNKADTSKRIDLDLEVPTSSELHQYLVDRYGNDFSFYRISNVENLNFGYEPVGGSLDFNNMQRLVLTLDGTSLSRNLPQLHWTMTDTYDYRTKNHQAKKSRAWFTDPHPLSMSLSLGLLPVVKPAWQSLSVASATKSDYVWLLFALPTCPVLEKMKKPAAINCVSDLDNWPFENDVPFYKITLVVAQTLEETSYDAQEIVYDYYEQKCCCTLF